MSEARRCPDHGHPLAYIEGAVNGDPWVCPECAYRSAWSLLRQAEALEREVLALRGQPQAGPRVTQ